MTMSQLNHAPTNSDQKFCTASVQRSHISVVHHSIGLHTTPQAARESALHCYSPLQPFEEDSHTLPAAGSVHIHKHLCGVGAALQGFSERCDVAHRDALCLRPEADAAGLMDTPQVHDSEFGHGQKGGQWCRHLLAHAPATFSAPIWASRTMPAGLQSIGASHPWQQKTWGLKGLIRIPAHPFWIIQTGI